MSKDKNKNRCIILTLINCMVVRALINIKTTVCSYVPIRYSRRKLTNILSIHDISGTFPSMRVLFLLLVVRLWWEKSFQIYSYLRGLIKYSLVYLSILVIELIIHLLDRNRMEARICYELLKGSISWIYLQ